MNLDIKKYEPIFGEWIVDKCIGNGSVGKVYRIVRENFGIKYTSALKVISIPQDAEDIQNLKDDGLEEPDIREYYKSLVEEITKEINTMLELKNNSNIVNYEEYKVIPHENELGWDILVRMELLTPLPEYYRKNNITEYAVVKMGIDICQALSVYHKAGIVHKAIKPENIFVSPVGEFKLGDFGVAYKAAKTVGMPGSKGTQWYMAPEVYRQDTYNSSAETYSLSLVLYRLLNHNRFPFFPEYPKSISHEDRNRAFEMKMKGVALQNPANASEKIAHIIKKGCEFHPQKRYSTTERMQKELEKALVDTDNKKRLLYQEKMSASAMEMNSTDSKIDSMSNHNVKSNKLVYVLAIIISLLVLTCFILWKFGEGKFSSKKDTMVEPDTEVLSTQEVLETESNLVIETENSDISHVQKEEKEEKETELVEVIPEEEMPDKEKESNVSEQPVPQQESINNQPPQQTPVQEPPQQPPVQEPPSQQPVQEQSPQQPPAVNEEEILFDNSISEEQLFE